MTTENFTDERIYKVLPFLFSVLLLCLGTVFIFPLRSYAADSTTVRVGYYASHNFQEGLDEKAYKSGYSYEYLQKVAAYTGWHYEYVYGDWSDLYQQLLDGDIDLMAGIAYNTDRAEVISYPQYEMLNETFYIYKDADDTSIKCGNIASYSGKKIGTLAHHPRISTVLDNWIADNQADVQIIQYDDINSCAKAFNSKEIDAFVSADNIVSSYSGITPVEKIGKEPYYLCVTNSRPDLLDKLNLALSIIDEQDAIDLDELHNKYSAESSINIFLSNQEIDWMAAHDTITVGYPNHYLPYSDTAKDGSATGLIADVIPDLFAALPANYSPTIIYKAYDNQKEMIESLKSGEIDMVFPVSDEVWYAEQKGYQQSSGVVTSPIDLVYKEPFGDDTTKVVAVNKNNLLQYCYTIINFPDAQIVKYDSSEDCISAVKKGIANSTIVSAHREHYLVGSEKQLNSSPLSNAENCCFGVTFGNSALLQLLNHGLSILGDEYGLNHTYQYIDDLNAYTTKDFILDHIELVLGVIVFLLIYVILVFIRHDQNMRLVAEKDMKQKAELENALTVAQQATLARTVFLRNMSHDIRTPLNAVLGFTNLALDCEAEPQQMRDYLSKIRISGNHLLAIVNDVLEISRIESGQTRLNETACDLREIVDEASLIIQQQASEKHQNFTVDISQIHNHHIFCDKLRIKEILVNLLGNAVKFTPEYGHISFSLQQLPCSEDGFAFYEIHIKDDGCGISKAFMEKMFLPFEREQTSTASGIPGTGLGLSITRRFVDLMGGSIDVISEEGKGTEFIIRLRHRIAEPSQLPDNPVAGNHPEQTNFAGKHILLAEDNELNREIATTLLQTAGFEVDSAENGSAAVEKLKAAPAGFYTIILMDIQMPVMDGYEATKTIRNLPDPVRATIPIIAVSANAFEEDQDASLASGMNGHLAKPIDPDQLLSLLHTILK